MASFTASPLLLLALLAGDLRKRSMEFPHGGRFTRRFRLFRSAPGGMPRQGVIYEGFVAHPAGWPTAREGPSHATVSPQCRTPTRPSGRKSADEEEEEAEEAEEAEEE